MRSQSPPPSVGRCRKTSPRTWRIRSRMRSPPCTVNRISQPIRPVAMDREEKTEICLEAHEALVKANVDNLPLFKDVIQYLKMELGGDPPT